MPLLKECAELQRGISQETSIPLQISTMTDLAAGVLQKMMADHAILEIGKGKDLCHQSHLKNQGRADEDRETLARPERGKCHPHGAKDVQMLVRGHRVASSPNVPLQSNESLPQQRRIANGAQE